MQIFENISVLSEHLISIIVKRQLQNLKTSEKKQTEIETETERDREREKESAQIRERDTEIKKWINGSMDRRIDRRIDSWIAG